MAWREEKYLRSLGFPAFSPESNSLLILTQDDDNFLDNSEENEVIQEIETKSDVIPSDGNFSQMLLAFAHSTDTNTITIGAL